MAKGGLFAVMGPPSKGGMGGMMGEDDDDYSDDSAPAEEEDPGEVEMGGPFDAYAETIFDPKADVAAKTDALRQAIMTLIEEKGGES